MADWSLLPNDLIANILLKSKSPGDFVRFSMVCHAWNKVSFMVKPKWISNNTNTPWLLLAEPGKSNPQENRMKIFSIGGSKYYKCRLPTETFGARCWGSSYGWIVMLHRNKQIYLYNPITKAQLSLPPLLTISDDDWCQDDRWFQKILRKFIVLKMTQKDNIYEDDFVVMVIHWRIDHLAFARPGDQAWTQVLTTCQRPRLVSDVMCSNGLVMILYQDGALATCDVSRNHNGNPAHELVEAKDYLPAPPDNIKYDMGAGAQMYMVELASNLLVVSRYKLYYGDIRENFFRHTYIFYIHKLDYETKVWERLDDLGGYLLFVGSNTALCVHELDAPFCRRNAIYFTDDTNVWGLYTFTCEHDMGVFDLASKKITTFVEGDDILRKSSAPLWFIPKF